MTSDPFRVLRVNSEQPAGETMPQLVARSLASASVVYLLWLMAGRFTRDAELRLLVGLCAAVIVLAALEGSRFRRLHQAVTRSNASLVGLRSDLIAPGLVGPL
jgi:hypothetical protein